MHRFVKKKKIPYFCLQHGINSPFILNRTSKYKYKNFFYDFIYLTTSKFHAEYLKKIKLVKNYVLIKNKIFNLKIIKRDLLVVINSVGEKNNINSARQIFQSFEYAKICAKNFPNTKIFVRLHPSQNSNKLVYDYFNNNKFQKNIIIQNPDKINIDSALKTCIVAFFYEGSSLLMDAIKNSVIPIVLEETGALYDLSFLKKRKVLLSSKTINSCWNLTFEIMQKSFFRNKIKENIVNFNRTYFENNDSKNILDVINNHTKYNHYKDF